MATERVVDRLDRGTRFALWLRRPQGWVEIVAWAALVAFVVFTIGPALIGHGTFLNTGLLNRYTPWGESFETTAGSTNILTSDTLDSVFPQTTLLVRSAHEGVFAAWNPFVAGGVELGGVPNSGAWSPLSLPWWILPFSYAPGAVKLLEIVAVTVGMSLLLRRWGIPRAAWPIASLVFASSGFMVAWSNWPQTRVAAFIPLLFWAIDRAAVELRARDVISVGAVVASMLLGGFPAVVGYGLFVGGIFFLARTIVAHRALRGVVLSGLIAVGGIVFGLLLAAWQLVPFAISASNVVDFGGRGQHGGSGLGSRPMVTSWIPDVSFLGSSGAAWSNRNPVEEYSYIGIAAVVLIAAAVLIRPATNRLSADLGVLERRRTRGVLTIIAAMLAFSVVLVFLGGPILAAARELPVFDSNPIGRARVVVGFFAAALAGIGFGRVVEPENLRDELARFRAASPLRRAGRIAAIVLVVLFTLSIGLQTMLALEAVPTEYVHQTKVEALTVGIIGAAVGVAVLLAWFLRSRVVHVLVAVAIAAMVVVPAISATQKWWPIASLSTFYPTTPAIEYLQQHVSDQERYATTGSATLPGSATYYGVRSVTGHAFQTREWKQLMRSLDPDTYPTATYLSFSPNLIPSLVESTILDRVATKYLVADPSAPLAGTVEDGASQTKWSDLTADNPSVDSASNTGPLNGITITGPPALTTSDGGMTLTVAVIADGTGKTLAKTESWVPSLGGGRNIALPGSDIPADTSWHVRITITGQSKLVPIGTDDDGHAVMSITRPVSGDGVSVVHTGDATVYERDSALDRVRWASDQQVVTTAAERISTLADPSLPDDTVVLNRTPDHTAAGGDATVDLRDGDTNETVADVDASAGGWLVVADSVLRPGWSATVDGEPSDLVTADNAGGAVWVPKGEHTVRLHYSVPGAATGGLVTGGAVLVALAASVLVSVTVRRRRRAADAGDDPRTGPDGHETDEPGDRPADTLESAVDPTPTATATQRNQTT